MSSPTPDATGSDILFCEHCAESIPAGDFEGGHAITSDGRHYHQACALSRSLAMSGARSWLSLGLALYAAGLATFLVVVSLGGHTDPDTIPAAVEARIEGATRGALDILEREHATRLAEVVEAGERQREDVAAALAEEVEGALGVLTSRLEEYERGVVANRQALGEMVVRNERELAQLQRVLEEVARRAGEEAQRRAARVERDPAARDPGAVDPGSGPAPEEPPEPGPAPEPRPVEGSGPHRDPGHDADVDRWIPRLEDPNENIRFTATLELGRLKDRRAAPALIQVLSRDREPFVRLGAATALGSMGSLDAVSALVEALDDRDGDVRTAAKDSLQGITQQVIRLEAPESQNPGRREWRALQKKWRIWWRENEAGLRAREDG